MKTLRVFLPVAVLSFVACQDASGPRFAPAFSSVQAILAADCGGCHGMRLNQTFAADLDSATLVASGYINPQNAGQSAIILKPRNVTPHGGGYISTFTEQDENTLIEWIRRQPISAYSYLLRAKRINGAQAPVIDGLANDVTWADAPTIRFPIQGGWAGSIDVEMSGVYDDQYAYFTLRWYDEMASEKRQPWVKQSDGTWKTASAKPAPYPRWTWVEYMGGSSFDEEGPDKLYEDKAAIIWNTYGASTVPGFDNGGCAVLCHDPNNEFRPGTAYNYSDENKAAKKYTNAPSEIADMWHWKYVRMNQHNKMDDQYVRYWVPNTGDPHEGGRTSDAGSGGYADNPAANGKPTYRNPASVTAPPFYILSSAKVALTQEELTALPVGALIPNMITSGPTGLRADIDARGVHSGSMWTLEIRRKLVTGDANDVQFNDLAREYVFGVAVFDNAQIEHSYSLTPLRLAFQR